MAERSTVQNRGEEGINEMKVNCMTVLPITTQIHSSTQQFTCCEMTRCYSLNWYLMVYSNVPSSFSLRSLLGVVMLWAMDFLPLRKKVSGVQILLASRLFRGSISIGPLKHKRSSFQLWRKNTSMVYSCWNENISVISVYLKAGSLWGTPGPVMMRRRGPLRPPHKLFLQWPINYSNNLAWRQNQMCHMTEYKNEQ